jgi:hypothetical protein
MHKPRCRPKQRKRAFKSNHQQHRNHTDQTNPAILPAGCNWHKWQWQQLLSVHHPTNPSQRGCKAFLRAQTGRACSPIAQTSYPGHRIPIYLKTRRTHKQLLMQVRAICARAHLPYVHTVARTTHHLPNAYTRRHGLPTTPTYKLTKASCRPISPPTHCRELGCPCAHLCTHLTRMPILEAPFQGAPPPHPRGLKLLTICCAISLWAGN